MRSSLLLFFTAGGNDGNGGNTEHRPTFDHSQRAAVSGGLTRVLVTSLHLLILYHNLHRESSPFLATPPLNLRRSAHDHDHASARTTKSVTRVNGELLSFLLPIPAAPRLFLAASHLSFLRSST